MIGREKLLKKLESALAGSRADETEVVFWGSRSSVTRYAGNHIHQNMASDRPQVFIRSVVGKKIGLASTTSLDRADLRRTRDNSFEIALVQPDRPQFPGLPNPARYRQCEAFDDATARLTPAKRAKMVKSVIDIVKGRGLSADGAFSCDEIEMAVVNSRGVAAYVPTTKASLMAIVSGDTSSGYATGMSWRTGDIDPEDVATRAADKCDLAADPVTISPGRYEVILEPHGVADFIGAANMIGFGSRAIANGTSFLTGKFGKKVVSDQITIYDNAYERGMIGVPFDFEGVPRKKVMLIDRGVAVGGVRDRMIDPNRPDGHAPPPPWAHFGAWAWHLAMKPGHTKRADMVAGVKRGLLVTRINYIRTTPGSRSDTITGLTRDGTYLIRNGEIVGGVKNLRLTESFTRTLKTTVAVSRERELIVPDYGAFCSLVPTLHLKSFHFTGNTEE